MTYEQLEEERDRLKRRINLINVNCDGLHRLRFELRKVESELKKHARPPDSLVDGRKHLRRVIGD